MSDDRNDENDRIAARLRVQRHRARQRGEDVPHRKPGPRPKAPVQTIPAHPGEDRAYALDFLSVVRHVATELDDAGQRGATVREMAATYRHPVPTDLGRVRHHHDIDSDYEAVRFLLDRAVSALGVQLRGARRNSAYRLAVAFEDVRWDGEQIHRTAPE